MKTCARCCESKDEADFNRNRSTKDGLSVYCRECQNAYHRAWVNGSSVASRSPRAAAYLQRKRERARTAAAARKVERDRATAARRSGSAGRFVAAIRLSLACVDCGWVPDETTRGRLHFDHHEPGWKVLQGRVGRSAIELTWTLGRIAEEILDRCDPRCASCHGKRTAAQLRAAWEQVHRMPDRAIS